VYGQEKVDAFGVFVHAVYGAFGHLETFLHANGIRD
jgi:hypothetical protein